MENIFALLILASFVLLIIGFFSPKTSLFWDKKNKSTRKRSSVIYGISLLIFFILFGLSVDDNANTSNSSSAQESETEQILETKPELTQQQLDSIKNAKIQIEIAERENQTITAPNLTASYEANEVQADENFKGRTFYVEGTVGDIKKDIFNDVYVILKGDQIFRDVQCFFDDKQAASQLKKGMRVTFRGKCDGLMINVLMKNCELVDNLSSIKKKRK